MLAGVRAGPLTVVDCDGSPAAVRSLGVALEAALAGGPAVLPVPATPPVARTVMIDALRPYEPAPPGVALVVATSGSTGRPKGVELTAAALRASATSTHARLGGPGRWLLTLPALHIAGIQVLVRSMLAGHRPAVMDLRAGFTPFGFTAAARRVRGRRYTALVPTQLLRLLDHGAAALDELRGFDAVLVGGARCPAALLDRARAAGVAVVTTYGMTETAGGCVYDGRPLDGVRCRIHALSGGGGTGRIELAGPMLAVGYRLDPRATATAFRDGWFRTDDRGRLGPDGALDVLGRLDDLIVTGGNKVAPALVERAIAATPGVADACVVGLPDAEWGELVAAAVVAADPTAPPDQAVLRDAVRELAGHAAVPKLIRFVDAFPVRGPGKVDRDAVRDLLIT